MRFETQAFRKKKEKRALPDERLLAVQRRKIRGVKAPLPAVSFLLEGPEDLKVAEPVDRLEEVSLSKDRLDQCIKINTELKDSVRGQVIALFRQYTDIFVWSIQDMLGVDPKVMTHHLGIRSGLPPIK